MTFNPSVSTLVRCSVPTRAHLAVADVDGGPAGGSALLPLPRPCAHEPTLMCAVPRHSRRHHEPARGGQRRGQGRRGSHRITLNAVARVCAGARRRVLLRDGGGVHGGGNKGVGCRV
jgi:hypothetical protein